MKPFIIDLTNPSFVGEYKSALQQFPELKSNVIAELEVLEKDPRSGRDAIPGFAQALWKTRLGVKGRFGKRGGYRMIYHVDWERRVVTPVALYFKKDIPDLPVAEIQQRFEAITKVLQTAPDAQPESTPPPELLH